MHFVFAVKYRKQLITGEIEEDIKQLIFDIAKQKGFKIDTMETDKDHIHILVDVPPAISAFDVAHQLKSGPGITKYV